MSVQWRLLTPSAEMEATPSAADIGGVPGFNAAVLRFLENAAADDAPILLILNDPHRSTRTRPILSMLASLSAGAALKTRFIALIATGTHVFNTEEKRAFEEVTLHDCGLPLDHATWHDASEPRLPRVGGVRMHPLIAECEYLMPIGSVEPHYFAGLTGPHKTATIGCMAYEDIERNHAGALSPASDLFKLSGNPIHEGIAEITSRLERDGKRIHAIGQVIRGDAIVALACGGLISVLEELAPHAAAIYRQEVPTPADILRLRVPPPLGRTLYQADKAIKNNEGVVRNGGGILVEAGCEDGIGPDAFMAILSETRSYAEAVSSVQDRGYRLGDHKAVKLRRLIDAAERGVHIAIASPHLSPSALRNTGIHSCRDVDSAFAWLQSRCSGVLRKGYVIDDAAMVHVALAT